MANVDDPRGFRVYQMEGKTVRSRGYTKATGAGTEILEGALVKRAADGVISPATAGDADSVIGVASHFASADEAKVDVIDDPEATYKVQATGTYNDEDAGQNVDIDVGTPTTVQPERSGSTVDMATIGTASTLPFKIIGLAQPINSTDNNPGEDNADLLVKINQSERGAGTSGI